jgi:hypothetical protein
MTIFTRPHCSFDIAVAVVIAFSMTVSLRASEPISRTKENAATRFQNRSSTALPTVEYAVHSRGNIQLAVANNGTFGTYGSVVVDPYTGIQVQSCIYPKNSDIVYLWVAALWVGAVVGRDTLVTTGTEDFYQTPEFWPAPNLNPGITRKSLDNNSEFYSRDAFSEEDFYAEYTDTVTDPGLTGRDPIDQRGHKPLYIKVNQRTMAWSYSYAQDFILFDYEIKNIGLKPLKKTYLGIWVDGDAWHISRNGPEGWNDDIVGFYRTHPAPEGCGFIDTVNIAWHADNDGDPVSGAWDYRSVRSVIGTKVVRTPSKSPSYSFNWWITNYSDPAEDFGPRRMGNDTDGFRSFGTRLGTPEGDANKYYIMRHPEFDYDLMEIALDHSPEGWLPPPQYANTMASGFDARYLLSFGPFDIAPGQSLPVSFAFVGGADFHQQPADFATYFDPQNPKAYYDRLNFDNLADNARWAGWIYDNPGVDTDGDGYAGKYRVCNLDSLLTRIDTLVNGADTVYDSVYAATVSDTFYYEGDGVPDFRGASPPQAPKMRIIPSTGKLTVRWNGYYSETKPDVFLRILDFEGYRVYLSLDDRRTSFSLLQSWDRDDYNRYVWKKQQNGALGWVLQDIPFTLDSLRAMYGDPAFDPLAYPMSRPLARGDTVCYFQAQDYNQSSLSDTVNGIHKVYPDAVKPPKDSTLWTDDQVTTEFGERLPKYYEYEYTIRNIQPTVPYYVAVTAFDFGSPKGGLPSLETEPTSNMIAEFAQTPSDTVEKYDMNVYVYPNPYRIDGQYAANGYENRDRLNPERARRINFSNLPKVCAISIYTLDGDLVRKLDHNFPEGGPTSQHDTWDLVTRNTQQAVSGIYYYVVESPGRTQIGKFVLIM